MPLWDSRITISRSELAARRRLLATDPSRSDVGLVVVLGPDRRLGETTQHRYLSDVGQRVGDRPLEKPLRRNVERRVGLEIVVEPLQRLEKTCDLRVPLERRRVVPPLRALRTPQRPVQEIV